MVRHFFIFGARKTNTMPRTRFLQSIFPPLFILLLAAGCGLNLFENGWNGPVKTQFEPVIKSRQNLVFRFRRPLVKISELGNWDSTTFFRFSPQVSGRFSWSATDELVFSPDQAFRFNTEYTLQAGQALVKLEPSAADIKPIRFRTEDLSFVSIQPRWTGKAGSLALQLGTRLNETVDLGGLTAGLSLEWNGKKLPVQIRQQGPGRNPVLEVAGTFPAGASGEAVLHLNADRLNPAFRKKWVMESHAFPFTIPSPSDLVFYGYRMEESEGKPVLILCSSQETDPAAQDGKLSLEGFREVIFRPHPEGLQAEADFPDGSRFRFLAGAGLTGKAGGKLKSEVSMEIATGEEAEIIRFASATHLYLPDAGPAHIPARIGGLASVDMEIYRIPVNNLPEAITRSVNGPDADYGYNEEQESYPGGAENTGILVQKKRLAVTSLQQEGKNRLIPLDLPASAGKGGALLVKIFKPGERWQGAKKLICKTDIGLLVKSGEDNIWIKATRLSTGRPIPSLTLKILSRNNQVMATGSTASDGICQLERSRFEDVGSSESIILAEGGGDMAFLSLRHTLLDPGRFPVQGVPAGPSGWKAYLSSSRNVFQPGETLPFFLLVRDRDFRPVPETFFPVRLLDPDRNVVKTLKCRTGKGGGCTFSFSLPPGLPTGSYTAEVSGEDGKTLASQSVFMETFEPYPMEITAAPAPALLPRGKDWNFSVSVDNLFGLPAAGTDVEARLSWENTRFAPAGYENYEFFQPRESQNATGWLLAQARTDAGGRAAISLPVSAIPGGIGMTEVSARLQVRDESGIPVYKTLRSRVLTQDYLAGFRPENDRLQVRKTNRISIVCLDALGKPVPGKAEVTLTRIQYKTVQETAPEEPGGYRYTSRIAPLKSLTRMVNMPSGKGEFPVFVSEEGYYLIQIKTPDGAELVSNLYASDYSDGEVENGIPNPEGNVELRPVKNQYAPGETAEILIQTPFPGTLSLCLEQNRVRQHHSLEVAGNSARWAFPVQAGMAPNVYVSATLTRPMGADQNQNPLTVAYGYVSVPVIRREEKLAIEVRHPERSGSGTSLPVEIELDAGGKPGLTLSLTDEGILNLTGFRMADPFDHFHEKQQLGVATHSAFGKLISNRKPGRALPGGDGMYLKMGADALENRVLLSHWDACGPEGSSTVKVTKKGKRLIFSTRIPIPAGFSGRGRLVVIAWGDPGMGRAESRITLADPITIKRNLPAYLMPGDRFEGRVSFFNTTRETRTIQPFVSLTEGNARVQADWPSSLVIPPGESRRLLFPIEARGEGTARISLGWKAGNREEKTDCSIPVTSPPRVYSYSMAGEIGPGTAQELSCPGAMLSKPVKAVVQAGRTPLLPYLPVLNQLLDYPYGCLEQTVSAAFPLLFAGTSKLDDKRWGTPEKRQIIIRQTLDELRRFALPEGGFSYWPSSSEAHPYYSVYATHFLLEARDLGYPVDAAWLDVHLKAVEELAGESDFYRFTTIEQAGKKGGTGIQKLAPHVPYALFVCSRNGKIRNAELRHWKSNRSLLDREGRAMLAAAFFNGGDPETAKTLLAPRFEQMEDAFRGKIAAAESGNWTTELEKYQASEPSAGGFREEAAVWFALGWTWPAHPMARGLSARFMGLLQTGPGNLNTLEKSMALTPLLRHLSQQESKAGRLVLEHGGRKPALPPSGMYSFSDWTAPLRLENRNSKEEGPLYYRINAFGTEKGKAVAEDKGLWVRRSLFDATGKPLKEKNLKLNDLVVVEIQVKTTGPVAVPDVAVVDLIPCALRVERKRLGQESPYTMRMKPSNPDRLDIRHDRVHLFITARPEVQTFYYSARVTGNGRFEWPGTEAQAMYIPGMKSRDQAIQIESGRNPPAGQTAPAGI